MIRERFIVKGAGTSTKTVPTVVPAVVMAVGVVVEVAVGPEAAQRLNTWQCR